MSIRGPSWYDEHADDAVSVYEAVHPVALHAWLAGLLPTSPGLVVDIGAGSGRDAAWFASLGHEVLAVEPSAFMRDHGTRLHDDARIRWVTDSLPSLATTLRLGLAADVVQLAAVWQHVLPADRPRAFRKLVGLLRSGGLLAVTLRHGPDDGRGMHPVSLEEVERLALQHGLAIERVHRSPDVMGRPGVSWTNVAFRLPDDGTGALPLLRHLVLADQKSSTYKLGLLRALCRIADGSAGLGREVNEEHVALPLGVVALTWLRLYLPLCADNLPQAPGNRRGAEGLGFAGAGFLALAAGAATLPDLRVGARFGSEAGRAVHAALREAADLVTRMPATYLTYPGGGRILPVERGRARAPSGETVLDAAYLGSFGSMLVPRDLWRAMQRYAVWVEPALVTEWMRLMRGYAERQGRALEEGHLANAMIWSDPDRDVGVARGIALRKLEEGKDVRCVWSGKRLEPGTLDIDHCLPWSAWPCSDLWNLMPAHRRVNQHQKRDRLPSGEALRRAADGIFNWWNAAYLVQNDLVMPRKFVEEARASLPGLSGVDGIVGNDKLMAAVALQRLRLRRDQGIPEWP
ncbi:MAG: methyltransferase domain-containing protein [Janthinobacterium lividum]